MLSLAAPVKLRETTSIPITTGVHCSIWTSLCVLSICLEVRLIGIPGPSQTKFSGLCLQMVGTRSLQVVASLTEDDSLIEYSGSQQVLRQEVLLFTASLLFSPSTLCLPSKWHLFPFKLILLLLLSHFSCVRLFATP